MVSNETKVIPIMCGDCIRGKKEPIEAFGNKFCEHFPSESFKDFFNKKAKELEQHGMSILTEKK